MTDLRKHIREVKRWVLEKVPFMTRGSSIEYPDFPPEIRRSLSAIAEELLLTDESKLERAKAYVLRNVIQIDPRLEAQFKNVVSAFSHISNEGRSSFVVRGGESQVHVLFPLPKDAVVPNKHGSYSKGMPYFPMGDPYIGSIIRDAFREMEEEGLPTPKAAYVRFIRISSPEKAGEDHPTLHVAVVLDERNKPDEQLHRFLDKLFWRLKFHLRQQGYRV